MLDMRHIKITNHSLWCQATNSQVSNNHSMLGSSVKPTSRQCYLSIVSQFKAMACMEPYFHVNHEILTLGFQKPKPVTILSKRSHQIFFFFLHLKGPAKSLQSCPTLCDPTDDTPQASPSLGFSKGKNTGVGCHFLLQCMEVKSESEVTQLCPTPRDPMDCSPPGSSIHGIFQARVLEWGAIAFSVKGPRRCKFK